MRTLNILQEETSEWANRNFPDAKPYQPLLGAMEELGELSEMNTQKIREQAQSSVSGD